MGDYEKDQARLLALWKEGEAETDESINSENDSDEVYVEDSDQSSIEISDYESVHVSDDEFVGKDGVTKWRKNCGTKSTRRRSENIITNLPGVKQQFKDRKTPIECWNLFFDEEIVERILTHTNVKIIEKSRAYKESEKYKVKGTTKNEILAVFGLLYLAGYYKSGRQNLSDVWAQDDTGVAIFRNTMTMQRFYFLLSCMRFDDTTSREQRKKLDKLCPIRDVFEKFVQNCQETYTPSEYLTIDEKLEAFRGRCSFRQYIPNKPSKYGIKIFALVDARCFYVVKMEVYVGQQPEGPFRISNKPEDVVIRLISPISGTKRNITFDNWFTSYNLMNRLLQDHSLTSVGTIRKNKRELPPVFLSIRGRPVRSSLFGFQKNITLVSYTPKKNKNVLLFSTLHHDDSIDESSGDSRKPEIISFYNQTKGGVDTVDKLAASYDVSRQSKRWPLTVFYSLLNTAGVNSEIVYRNNTNDYKTKRRVYLKKLGQALICNHVSERENNPRIPRAMQGRKRQVPLQKEDEIQKKKRRCDFCPRGSDRKSQYFCGLCFKTICLQHALFRCQECCESENELH